MRENMKKLLTEINELWNELLEDVNNEEQAVNEADSTNQPSQDDCCRDYKDDVDGKEAQKVDAPFCRERGFCAKVTELIESDKHPWSSNHINLN